MFNNVTHVKCCKCSAPIYMEQEVWQHLRTTGRDFWCLNGHVQSYTAVLADEKRIKELEAQVARDRREAAEREAALRGALRDVKLEKNKCPDCTRKFESPGALKRHRTAAHRHLKALPENAGKSN